METLTSLPFTSEDLGMAIDEVLATIGEPIPFPTDGLTERVVFASHVIIRAEDGSGAIELYLAAPTNVAAALAGCFFGAVESEQDMIDAMGELSNLAGGAIKPYLADTWVIGIPERDDPVLRATEGIVEASGAFGTGLLTVAAAPADWARRVLATDEES